MYFMKRHGNVIPIDKSNEFDNNKAPRPKKHEIYGVIDLFDHKLRESDENVPLISRICSLQIPELKH